MNFMIKLFPGAKMPTRATPQASGFDCFARLDRGLFDKTFDERFGYRFSDAAMPDGGPLLLRPHGSLPVPVPLGFALALPPGFEAQIRPRSGLSMRGIVLLPTIGTIDADYRGCVLTGVLNIGPGEVYINEGDAVAQMVIVPVGFRVGAVASAHDPLGTAAVFKPSPLLPTLTVVDQLDETERGTGGFGSTDGKR